MLKDELLSAALAMIRRHEEGAEAPERLLSTEADDVISGLGFLMGTAPGDDLDALQALGWLHWFRYEELMRRYELNRASEEHDESLKCLLPVYRKDPLAVPEAVEQVLNGSGPQLGPELMNASDDNAWTLYLTTAELSSTIGRSADREEARARLARVRQGVKLFPPGWTRLAASTLGSALIGYNSFEPDGSHIDEAIAVLRRALPPSDRASDPTVGQLLAMALHMRYRRTGRTEDLTQTVALLQHHVRGRSATGLHQLAEALRDQYTATGRLECLTTAIRAARESAGVETTTMPRSTPLGLLSHLLRLRGEHTGDGGSLEEAVDYARQAVALAPSEERTSALTYLAGALSALAEHTGASAPYGEAGDLYRAVLDLLPDPTPQRQIALANLATTLFTLFNKANASEGYRAKERALAGIDEGIAHMREALTLSGSAGGYSSHYWATLGTGLHRRYEWTGDPDLLDSVVVALRRAVETAGALGLYSVHNAYASSLRNRYDCRHRPDDLVEAVRAARRAAEAPDASADQRIQAAARWGRWATDAEDTSEALRGYRIAVESLSRVAPRHLRRDDQERLLAGRFQLVSEAAAAALDADRPELALDLLETGRGVTLHSVLDHGGELSRLRAVGKTEADLANRYTGLRTQLDDKHLSLDHKHEVTVLLEQTVESIRGTKGFERFQLPPSPDALAAAGTEGPVVTVNVSDRRCDALALTGSAPRIVPLAALGQEELKRRALRFHQAVNEVDVPSASFAARRAAQATVRETLGWLWDVVAEPVLDALGLTHPVPTDGTWQRIWWSPTGWLTQLPLHAAGHHTAYGRSVLDRVISSYTPTLRTLLYARREVRTTAVSSAPRILAVAVPDAPGQRPLSAAGREADALATDPVRPPLKGRAATRRDVVARMPDCDWAHFACHAHIESANPSASHLVLHDQPLTVADIDRLKLSDPELAYLSACSTGMTTALLATESIHLGSAFQLAGFRHVIATYWKARDNRAYDMARSFYSRLPRHTNLPPSVFATALHHAVRQVRAADPNLPASWAGYFHSGP
ncbi:CHAT domain-containing protein [Streptomyces xiamenensis]